MTHEIEENCFVDICDDIIFKLDNNEFNYVNSKNYNKLIAKIFSDLAKHTISNNEESNSYSFFKNYSEDEQVTFDIIKSLLRACNELNDINLTNSNDITFLEKYFNEISSKLTNKNLPVKAYNSSSNIEYPLIESSLPNYKQIIKANEKSLDNLNLIVQQQNQIDFQNRLLYQREFLDRNIIETNHDRVLNILINTDFKIWKDTNNKLFYRLKAFEEKQRTNKNQLSDIIKNITGISVDIYDSKSDVKVIDANYLITSLLPTVRREVFNPFCNSELFHVSNNLYYKNQFEYTELLSKRFSDFNQIVVEDNIRQVIENYSFIENFLRLIFQDEKEFYCFFDWLTSFFYHLHKSDTALVLIGDNETTDIIMNNIIKPIFIKNKKYLSTISNSILEKQSEDKELLENKIFYHFNNLNEKVDTKRVSKLIRSIVKPNIITASQAWDENEPYIYGEVLITSNKDSPYSYLKNVLSACSVLRIKDMQTILKKLSMDYLSFEKAFIADLENFMDRLLVNAKNNYAVEVLETDEKFYLNTMKNGVLITPKIDRKIDYFINDIQRTNHYAFSCIKSYDAEIYEEFIYSLKEKMIAQPMISKYFNIYYDEEIIPDNNEFIKILQNKADMFNSKPNDKNKHNGKKRYEIF